MADRAPCINPRCRRTCKNEGAEVICGKCFRSLPVAIRADHRRYWREYRKWDRRIKRTSDEAEIQRMRSVRDRYGMLIDTHWEQKIKPYFLAPEKPDGLETFFEEMGWR